MGAAIPAKAALATAGPVDPSTHFPAWYSDTNGLQLEPCLTGLPLCTAAAADLVAPDGEMFYQLVQASIPMGGTATADLTLALEGAYGGSGNPRDEVVFQRTRLVVKNASLVPNATYTVTHPFGTQTYTADATGQMLAKDNTNDFGCAVAPIGPGCDFSIATESPNMGPFLRWDPAVAPAPPAGYVGDNATPHKVVGSPKVDAAGQPQNYFRIQGPNLDKTTDQFTLLGKIYVPPVTASPTGGSFGAAGTSVTLTSSAAKILFTTDGTDPGPTNATTQTYVGPIQITATTTLKFAAADAAGNIIGTVLSQTYTIDATAPGQPTALVLAPGSDTGVASDNLTNVTLPTVTGAAVEPMRPSACRWTPRRPRGPRARPTVRASTASS